VVSIDMQITFGDDVDIDQAVTCNLVEHMFEEGYAGIQFALTGTIEVDLYFDLRLKCIALNLRLTLCHLYLRSTITRDGH
jgi:hypothetical protein